MYRMNSDGSIKIDVDPDSDRAQYLRPQKTDTLTPDTLTPAALNLALAGLIGVDLTARTEDDIDTAVREWWNVCDPVHGVIIGLATMSTIWKTRHGRPYQDELEARVAAFRRDPPDYAGDLITAFTLGEEMRKRGIEFIYGNEIEAIVYKHQGDLLKSFTVAFQVAHASAYDRALAAFRAWRDRMSDTKPWTEKGLTPEQRYVAIDKRLDEIYWNGSPFGADEFDMITEAIEAALADNAPNVEWLPYDSHKRPDKGTDIYAADRSHVVCMAYAGWLPSWSTHWAVCPPRPLPAPPQEDEE